MPTWTITREDAEPEFIEADDLASASALAAETGPYVSVARMDEPVDASSFTTPDGQKWTLGLTAAGNPKWVKVAT